MFFLLILLFFSVQIHSFSPSTGRKNLLYGTIIGVIIIGSFYIFRKYSKKDNNNNKKIPEVNHTIEKKSTGSSSNVEKKVIEIVWRNNEQKYALQPILKSDIQEIIEKHQQFDLTGVEKGKEAEYLEFFKKSRKNFLTTMLEYDLHQKVIDRKNNILGYIMCQSYYTIPLFVITDEHSIEELGTLLLDNILPQVKEACNKGTTKRRFFEIEFDQENKNLQKYINLFENYGFKQLPCRMELKPPQLVWALEWEAIKK